MFVCLVFYIPLENFSLTLRHHHYRWRPSNLDLYSELLVIEQRRLFNVLNVLWHGVSVYNGHLRAFGSGAVTTCVYNFCMSSLGIEHQTFRMRGNLTKVRPLLSLSQGWFNNSPLQMVFKWTLYGLCICILRHDFDHLDSVFYIVQYFSWGWKKFCCYVLVSLRACSLHRSRVQTFRNIFSRIEVTIWLVNIINTEHDQ